MKKTVKYLRFENLKMQLQQKHPKQVSRAVMCFKDHQGNIYKTGKYGQVTPQTIYWEDAVQIIYTNQEMFKLQTVCQHEYGYAIEELEAMYNGEIYIKTQNFFRPLTVHIFNSEGTKCGILRYLIKIIQKQVAKTAKKQQVVQQQQPVKVDLIGKITLHAASLSISIPSFKKQKYANDFLLTVKICGQKFQAIYKKNFQWIFQGSKVQYMQNSPDDVKIAIFQNQDLILEGQTTMKTIMENKRFLTHIITLYNTNEQKTGVLKLDLRFITKQQLLDLMYSPTKLTKLKDQSNKNRESHDLLVKKPIQSSRISKARANSSMIQTTRKTQQLQSTFAQNAIQPEALSRAANRYKKVHVTNSYNQIIFPKQKRFSQPKNVNPYVSYSDPYKNSDFSPNNKNGYTHSKGPDISLSKKYDFTRPYKGNPGVGQYKLPSIWDKY